MYLCFHFAEDNDQCRLTFSMSQGMKMFIPMYAQANIPLGSLGENVSLLSIYLIGFLD